MTMQVRLFPVVICVVILFSNSSLAQTPERRQTNSSPQSQEQLSNLPQNANSLETVANELGLLRKSLQTLNARLREISEKNLAPDSKQGDSSKDQQNRISLSLDLLSRAEQRAEAMRKQLLELIEKEISIKFFPQQAATFEKQNRQLFRSKLRGMYPQRFKSRLVQIEEDMRPDSIERAMSLNGSTRTPELRDTRRRVLESERRGLESLLNQTSQSRIRLEDDVKQADALVAKLRQRVLPLIDREIEKINPN